MEFKKTLRKFFKAKTSAELPQKSINGQVLYAEDENSLYIDTETSRNRINPPADWEETDVNSSSYVANKPELGSVAAKNVATSLEDSDNIPTVAQMNEIIENVNVWIKVQKPDLWEDIINNQNYALDYKIGKQINLDLGEYGIHPMELVAINADDKADNSGKAKMTWISKNCIGTHIVNSSDTNENGWINTNLRSWLKNNIEEYLPEILKQNIVEVNKTYYDSTSNSTKVSVDTVWIPSAKEVFGISQNDIIIEDSGIQYTTKFTSNIDRIKQVDGVNRFWWLRSSRSGYNHAFLNVGTDGSMSAYNASSLGGIVLGFCI